MKKIAFAMGSLIAGFGIFGFIAPDGLAWLARHALHPGVFWFGAAVRVFFGLMLLGAAEETKLPKTIFVLGIVVLLAGFVTAGIAMWGMTFASNLVTHWASANLEEIRLTALPITTLGALVSWSCGPEEESVKLH